MPAGIKVFQALSVKDHPSIIDDKHSPDLSNCRIDSPIGALSNMEGTEKYNSVGYGNPIVAIHQLNGSIFSLSGSKLYEGYPTYASAPSANAGADQSKDTSDTVTLDGSASTNAVSYLWTQTSGTTVTLSSTTAQKPTFTMPAGNVTFSLKVTNYWGNDTDTVDVTLNVILITNCVELQAMQNDLAGNYKLANDIDCTYCTQDPAGALYNAGAGFEPVGTIATPFTGVFDGNGYTITGLKINRPATNYIGLFGVCRNVEIKNVGMINVDTSGNDDVGSLVGLNRNDNTVTNCYATGAVSGVGGIGGGTGGLVGRNYSSSIMTNCYSTCVVSGNPYIGGLVGRNNSGVYADCFWDTETSGQATSAGGTGKTTAQMKQEATFTNWDFTTIWAIVEDTSYPTLR